MNTAEAILTRRSTRKFKQKAIDKELINEIVEAGRFAPSGGNSQTNHFFVITDKIILQKLAQIAQDAFGKMEVYEGMYPSLRSSIVQSKAGNYVFHYNAPCLIVVANRKEYGNNIADTACALENMMILANAKDLGSCYINQLKWLNENQQIIELFTSFGMKDDERIYGSIALGYPDTQDGLPERKQIKRKGNEVVFL